MDLRNKKLYRLPRNGILLGIAAGMARYFEVDPVFVRLVWLFAAVVTHVWPVMALYGILFFVVPVDPSQDTVDQHQEPKDVTKQEEKMDENQNM